MYPTSSTRLKPRLKNIYITLLGTELIEDFHGDKRSYFLAQLNDSLNNRFVAQYGTSYHSILIFESGNPTPLFQRKLSVAYSQWFKSEKLDLKEFRIKIPESFLFEKQAVTNTIVLRLNPVPVSSHSSEEDALKELSAKPNRVLLENHKTGLLEVYTIRQRSEYGSKFAT